MKSNQSEEAFQSPDGNSNVYGIESMDLKPMKKALPPSTIKPFDDSAYLANTGSTVSFSNSGTNLDQAQENKMVSSLSLTAQIKPSDDLGYPGNTGIGTISFSTNDAKLTIGESITISGKITSTNSDHSAHIHIKNEKTLTLTAELDLKHLILSNDQGKELDIPASEFKLPCTINDQLEIQPLGLVDIID